MMMMITKEEIDQCQVPLEVSDESSPSPSPIAIAIAFSSVPNGRVSVREAAAV